MQNNESIWDGLYKKGLFWRKISLNVKKIMNNKSVLELGVGNGKTLRAIISQKPKDVTAIDISEQAIKISLEEIKSEHVKFLRSDFLNFKTNKKFDVVVCYYFLNNFKNKERIRVVKKIKDLIKVKGHILVEDFEQGDFRNKGKSIEKNTIKKIDGRVCHFFEKNEICELFKDFYILDIKEKTFFPIRKDKKIKRKILNVLIRNKNAPDRI